LFRNPEASIRIAKWAAKLSGYIIIFEPRTAIKSQVLGGFIVNWTGPSTSNHHSTDKCTNNKAEYEAVILGLRKLIALEVTTCIVKTDSKIVAGQIKKDCIAREPVLMQYLSAVRRLEK
jgi:ribonuclease HI